MKKKITHVLVGAMALTMAFTVAAITAPESAAAKVNVKKVTAEAPSGKTAYVAKGKKVTITTTVKVTPNKKANKKVTYKTANKKIATVSSKGVIKGVKAGKTKITIISKKNKKKKTTMKVVVKKAAVKNVKLNETSFNLSPGAKKTLKATVSPAKNVSNKIVWTSSNKKVATVTSKGVVKGIKDGKAIITAKAADGSNKKAKATVTVGSGIASISVPTSNVVRVVLSGAKTLKASDFIVQTKSSPSATRYTSVPVESVSTKDNKVYDVNLERSIYEGCYLKVTISALSSNKSSEIYVENIAGYGNATNETVEYLKGTKGHTFTDDWYISNSNAVGSMTYSVTGLPSGLKSYISKDKTDVLIRGKFNNIENGTTATLTGTDEKGTIFTKKYIFVVGDIDHLVAVVEPAETKLAYIPDDPKTAQDEESGDYIGESDVTDLIHVSGGTVDQTYNVTCNGKSISEWHRNSEGKIAATPAGTYNFNVEITDDNKENLKTSVVVTLVFDNGVTVSGTVLDAAGQPAKGVSVYGYTKRDSYGRRYSLSATTEANGTYTTRAIKGDYYTYCGNYYDMTVGNIFNGNTTKNFALPLYRVNFVLNVPNAVAYSGYMYLIDAYGTEYYVHANYGSKDGDYSMYTYLKPGAYEVDSYYDDYDEGGYNMVSAFGKVESDTESDGTKHYWLSDSDSLGRYRVSGSFNVTGNNTVTLNGAKSNNTTED